MWICQAYEMGVTMHTAPHTEQGFQEVSPLCFDILMFSVALVFIELALYWATAPAGQGLLRGQNDTKLERATTCPVPLQR